MSCDSDNLLKPLLFVSSHQFVALAFVYLYRKDDQFSDLREVVKVLTICIVVHWMCIGC